MKTKISEFARHILLYSKGHYKPTDNVINDLKAIVSELAYINYCSDEEVWHFCAEIIIDFCPPTQQKQYLTRLFRPFGGNFKDQVSLNHAVDSALGFMSAITVKDNPLLPDGLGEVSPEIALAIKS